MGRRYQRRRRRRAQSYYLSMALIFLLVLSFTPFNLPRVVYQSLASVIGVIRGVHPIYLPVWIKNIEGESHFRQYKSEFVPLASIKKYADNSGKISERQIAFGITQIHLDVHPEVNPLLAKWNFVYNLWHGARIFRTCLVKAETLSRSRSRVEELAISLYQKGINSIR